MTGLAEQLLRLFEGFRPRVYKDVAGFATIGFGHKLLSGESFTGGLTVEQGLELLHVDFEKHENEVISLLSGTELDEYELEAMTSLCFNIGGDNLRKSTLLRVLRAGQKREAGWEFLKWRMAGGVPQKALIKRRNVESIWFLGAHADTVMDYARR